MESPINAAGQVQGLFEDALPAADKRFAGERLGYVQRRRHRAGNFRAGPRDFRMAGDHDRLASVAIDARPGSVTDAPEHDDLPFRVLMEPPGILGNVPGQPAAPTHDAILGASDDEIDGFGH